MNHLFGIDPGTNKCGLACFKDTTLLYTTTITTPFKDRLLRQKNILYKLAELVTHTSHEATIVSEEPMLQGKANQTMQRFLGAMESAFVKINWVHPMTVKKAMGSGSLDKMAVALAAGEKLETAAEKEIMADIIAREAWDESDAIAIGLTYMRKEQLAQ